MVFNRPQVNGRPGVGRSMHCVCDGSDVKPGGQGVHDALAGAEMYPSGHGVQDALPAPAKVPAGQTEQTKDPGNENDPGGQARQMTDPGLGAKKPDAQGVHGALPPGPVVPGAQIWAEAGEPRTRSSNAADMSTIERMSEPRQSGSMERIPGQAHRGRWRRL